jgi:L,D-peptidoglycan transpeptidase YkuD (ErfK/YbiS/YcfS/YnhG family)
VSRYAVAALAVALAALTSACGGSAAPTAQPALSPTSPSASASPSPSPTAATASATPRRTAAPAATRLATAPATVKPAAKPTPRPTPTPAPLLVERLNGVGDARQVISVTNDGYGTSYASLQGFTRTASGWTRTFGPWAARIGYNGFAPPGEKREGDGRTPSGSYGFGFMFGVYADPGVHFSYRRVTGDYIVWDDDSASRNYNLWVDTRTGDAGRSPEPMYRLPSYGYGAVIGYNTARTPGLGSAIFLHVSHNSATAGCVSVPQSELLALLRWLNPSAGPRIIMGPTSAVTH